MIENSVVMLRWVGEEWVENGGVLWNSFSEREWREWRNERGSVSLERERRSV